jgi:hypothetical protein
MSSFTITSSALASASPSAYTPNNNGIINIHYARVSTNNQTLSLDSQLNEMHPCGNNIIQEIHSVKNGMSDTLKNRIVAVSNVRVKHSNKNGTIKPKINLCVRSIDRITRNIKDMKFLIKHVTFITVRSKHCDPAEEFDDSDCEEDGWNTNTTTYDLKTDAPIIVEQIELAQKEMEANIQRSIINSNTNKTNNIPPGKDEKIRCANLRLARISRCLEIGGVTNVSNLRKFVTSACNLTNKRSWTALSKMSRDLGGDYVMDVYDIDNYYKFENTPLFMNREDIIVQVLNMCENVVALGCVQKSVFREFVNAIIHTVNVNETA